MPDQHAQLKAVDLAILSKDAYRATPSPEVVTAMRAAGYSFSQNLDRNASSGFFARVWVNDADKTVIIANRGTDTDRGQSRDLTTDAQFQQFGNQAATPNAGLNGAASEAARVGANAFDRLKMGAGVMAATGDVGMSAVVAASHNPRAFLDQQFKDAITMVKPIVDSHSGYRIIATGHSLGGGLAQLQNDVFGASAVTFDAPGAQGVASSDAFKQFANGVKPGYSYSTVHGEVHNFIGRATVVGNEAFTGRHIGGLETERIDTGARPGGRNAIKDAGLAVASGVVKGVLRGGPTGVVELIGGAYVAKNALGKFGDGVIATHSMDGFVKALKGAQHHIGNRNVDDFVGHSPVEKAKLEAQSGASGHSAQADKERAERFAAGERAGRELGLKTAQAEKLMHLSTLSVDGYEPAKAYAAKLGFECDLSKDGKHAIVSMGLSGESIKGQVVAGVGPKGYVMIKTGESHDIAQFTFVPRDAFAYPPKAGAPVEISIKDSGVATWKPDHAKGRDLAIPER